MSDLADTIADALRKQNISFEAGGGIGYGQTYAPEHYSSIDTKKSDKSAVLHAHLLARNPYLGAELGFLKLPEYHSKSHTSDYPAYKGLPAGTYPQTVDGKQDITANGLYARLNAYGPKLLGIEPYGFYGLAKINSKNHEHATYNESEEADLRQELSRRARYFGAGLQKEIAKNLNVRAEIGKIPHATVDYHTLDRDMTLGTLGLGYQW